jgi:hypothetical protein
MFPDESAATLRALLVPVEYVVYVVEKGADVGNNVGASVGANEGFDGRGVGVADGIGMPVMVKT